MQRAEHNLRKFQGSSGWRETLLSLVTGPSGSSFTIPTEDMDGGGMARCSPSGRPSIVCDVTFRFAASRVENYSMNIKQKKNIMHPFLNLSCLVLHCNPHLLCLTLCGDPKFLDLLGLRCCGMLLCDTSSGCNHGFFSLQFCIRYGFPVVSLLTSFLFSFCFLVVGLLTSFLFSFCFQFNN